MYAVIYGDNENGENIEVEGLFQTRVEAVKALYESASKTFDSLNIDIESCEEDEYDWSPRGQLPRPIKGTGLAKGLIPLYLSEVCNSCTWS